MRREQLYLIDLDRAEREALKNILAPGHDALLAVCKKLADRKNAAALACLGLGEELRAALATSKGGAK